MSQPTIVESAKPGWQVWNTIKLETGIKDANGFRNAIREKGMQIRRWTNDMLGKPGFTVAPEPTEVDLVTITVAELGFERRATCEQIYATAKECGLALCPREVGPQLRLQYSDQSKGEWLLIGIEPITDSDGNPSVFLVGHDYSGLWLDSIWVSPESVWHPDDRWVFVRTRK